MIRFLDGLAANVILQLLRAPLYLRVTQNTAGEWDGLDQLGDVALGDETITVYRRVGKAGWIHIDYRDKQGRRKGVTYATGDYAVVPEQPTDEVLRDTTRWREWATAQVAK